MKFYVYQHIRHDTNAIFYIGIGTKNKQDLKYNTYTRAYSYHKDNDIWKKIVSKTPWHFEILHEFDSRREAEKLESLLILEHGRLWNETGTLSNFTLGGEMMNVGFKHSEKTKEKISQSLRGKKRGPSKVIYTEELRKKISERQKEVSNRPEIKEFRRKKAQGNSYHTGKFHTAETKDKMREAALKRETLNCKTIKCKIIRLVDNFEWESNSIEGLSRMGPIPLSTLRSIRSRGYPGKKYKDYKVIFYE